MNATSKQWPNPTGSQLFLTLAPTPWPNGKHTIFGKVAQGMDVLRNWSVRHPHKDPRAPGDEMETVETRESAAA